jgi:hypothetical protein
MMSTGPFLQDQLIFISDRGFAFRKVTWTQRLHLLPQARCQYLMLRVKQLFRRGMNGEFWHLVIVKHDLQRWDLLPRFSFPLSLNQ